MGRNPPRGTHKTLLVPNCWSLEEDIGEASAHYPLQGIFRLDAQVDRSLV